METVLHEIDLEKRGHRIPLEYAKGIPLHLRDIN